MAKRGMLPFHKVDLAWVGRRTIRAVAEQHLRAVEFGGLGGRLEHQRQPAGGELNGCSRGVDADTVGQQVEA